jgi:hypothetical protein
MLATIKLLPCSIPETTVECFEHALHDRLCRDESEGRGAGLESLNRFKLLNSSEFRGGERKILAAKGDGNTLTVKWFCVSRILDEDIDGLNM